MLVYITIKHILVIGEEGRLKKQQKKRLFSGRNKKIKEKS